MDDAKLKQLRDELLEDRASQLELLDEHGADPYGEAVRDLGGDDEGFADSGQAAGVRSEALAQIEAARHRLHLVDDALASMDEGTYGRCVDCGADIPEERLEIRPLSIRCVTCAEAAG